MSSILSNLGVDEEDFDWYDLAVCRGMDTNLFYDQYEADPNIARNIDEMCLSCPVLSKRPKCSEEMSKNYESDNEDEDKWDNISKACWTGYKQVGMKEKGGRMVPNARSYLSASAHQGISS